MALEHNCVSSQLHATAIPAHIHRLMSTCLLCFSLLAFAMPAAAHQQMMYADLQECTTLDEGIRHRSIMSRVCGVEGVVSLQPDMTRRYLHQGDPIRCPIDVRQYRGWQLYGLRADHQKLAMTLTILPSPSCVLGATRTSSPSSPKTLLQTICFGFCILLANTTSPEAQTTHQFLLQLLLASELQWSTNAPTRTCPNVVVMCSSRSTSPLVLKVGSMLGPMHCVQGQAFACQILNSLDTDKRKTKYHTNSPLRIQCSILAQSTRSSQPAAVSLLCLRSPITGRRLYISAKFDFLWTNGSSQRPPSNQQTNLTKLHRPDSGCLHR